MVAWFQPPRQQPFTLRVHGVPYDLLALDDGRNVSPVVPYVLPESVNLEATADDLGGTLSFTVYQDITPGSTPWWTTIADNAPVTFDQNRIVVPVANPQPSLFTGFIDNITATINPGGAGTIAEVTCVNVNALLDRLMVRRFGVKKDGLGIARITIPEGNDDFQIKAILMYVAGARRFDGDLLFNPLDFTEITQTTTSWLAATEIQVGSLRTALETIVEAAQDKDGRRRAFYINPQTRRLVYGYAETNYDGTADATAPYEIVTDPAAENLVSPNSADVIAILRATPGLTAYFPLAEDVSPAPYVTTYASTINGNLLYCQLNGPGTNPIRIGGPYDSSETINYAQYFVGGPTHGRIIGYGDWAVPRPSSPYSAVSMWLFGTQEGVLASFGYYSSPVNLFTGWTIECDPIFITLDGRSFRSYYLKSYTAGTVTNSRLIYYDEIPPSSPVLWHNVIVSWSPVNAVVVYVDGTLRYASSSWPRPALDELGFFSLGGHISNTYPQGAGFFGPIAFFGFPIQPQSATDLYNAATWAKTPHRVNARSLELTSDQSRVYKTAMFMTADSSSDKDTDADPYIRSTSSLKNADGTALAFQYRAGPVFEALVDAPTARAADATKRMAQVDSLARAFFTTRYKPQTGARFAIRGAGPSQWQRYGFSAGWAELTTGNYRFVAEGWRPGQYVRVNAPQLGLVGLYRIESVTMSFEPGSFIAKYDIEIERRPRNRLGRLIIQE